MWYSSMTSWFLGSNLKTFQFSSVQSLSLTLCDPMDCSTPGLPITNSQRLLKLRSTESVMPSNHLILCHPLLLLPSVFPNIRVFSNESALCIRWPKYWSFSFNISPANEYSRLISFRDSKIFLHLTIQLYDSCLFLLSVCVPNCVWLLATPWTLACQVPLSMGFFPARILEWVAISSSGRSFLPRDWTHNLMHFLNWQMDSLPLSHLGR